MKKKYYYSSFFILFFAVNQLIAQEEPRQKEQDTTNIENLELYPNPVIGDKIYINTSKENSLKEVMIFDVLGKKVVQTMTHSEVPTSMLAPGIYIIKIREDRATATRKLIIR